MGQLNLAALARRYGVPYSVLWRAITGGHIRRRLPPDLERRLEEAVREWQEQQGGEGHDGALAPQ